MLRTAGDAHRHALHAVVVLAVFWAPYFVAAREVLGATIGTLIAVLGGCFAPWLDLWVLFRVGVSVFLGWFSAKFQEVMKEGVGSIR